MRKGFANVSATDAPPPPHVFHYWPLPTLSKITQLDFKPLFQ